MTPSPRLILVVDDNSMMREAMTAVLGSAGYTVSQAPDGNAAIAFAREHPVGLLITDLVMPEQEGIETIQHFVKDFPQIPIIAVSGMPEYLPVAKALGAAAVFEKPVTRADLLGAVHKLMG
jgi:CheY-like chemotaxis protein